MARRYRRNGDFELIAGLVVAGVVAWVGYEAYEGLKQTAAAANAGFASIGAAFSAFEQSVINGVTSPVTTFESWLNGGNAAPSSSAATTGSSSGFAGLGNTYGGGSANSSDSSSSSGGGASF